MAGAGHLMFERAAAIYHLQADVAAPLVPFTRFVDFLGKANEADGASYWREQLAGTVTANFLALPHAKYQPTAACTAI
jgi:hypothetical protein